MRDLSQMNYGTISAQPIEIHMPHLPSGSSFISQMDGRPQLMVVATVLVGDCECLLRRQAKPL